MQSRTNASLCSLIETDAAGCAGPAPPALANRQPSSRRKSTTLVECSVPLLGSRARSAEKSSPEGRSSGRATYSSSRFCVVEAISSAPPPEERGHVATDSLCPTVCCDLTRSFDGIHHHHCRVGSEGRRVVAPPCPRSTARLQSSPVGRVESFRSWSSHLFRGRPGGRRHVRSGDRLSDTLMWSIPRD